MATPDALPLDRPRAWGVCTLSQARRCQSHWASHDLNPRRVSRLRCLWASPMEYSPGPARGADPAMPPPRSPHAPSCGHPPLSFNHPSIHLHPTIHPAIQPASQPATPCPPPVHAAVSGTFNYRVDAVLDVEATRAMYLRRLRTLADTYLGTEGRLRKVGCKGAPLPGTLRV